MDTQIVQNQTEQIAVKWGKKQKFLFAISQLLPPLIFLPIMLFWVSLGLPRNVNSFWMILISFLSAIIINKLWANYRGFKSWKWAIGWSLLQFPLIYVLLFLYTFMIMILIPTDMAT